MNSPALSRLSSITNFDLSDRFTIHSNIEYRFSPYISKKQNKKATKHRRFLLKLVIFANLVTYCARSFASRLARGLAFAATTVLYGSLQVLRADSFNMCHGNPLLYSFSFPYLLYHCINRCARPFFTLSFPQNFYK